MYNAVPAFIVSVHLTDTIAKITIRKTKILAFRLDLEFKRVHLHQLQNLKKIIFECT